MGKLKGEILQGVELLLQSYNRNNLQASSEHPTKTLTDIRVALSGMAEVTTVIAKEDWVLKKLRFDSMYLREDSIEDAHAETFKWLLQDPNEDSKSITSVGSYQYKGADSEVEQIQKSGPEYEVKQDLGSESYLELDPLRDSKEEDNHKLAQRTDTHESPISSLPTLHEGISGSGLREYARASFIQWLRCGNNIFYISGKAGSGKSTLMKFLVQRRRTRDELTVWAGNKKLVFAHFFFWNSGTGMQKSLEGLYRSILFETLRECPDLIQEVFPETWKAASPLKESVSSDQTFRFPEILAAFESLIKSTSLSSSHKFCFFIDGLDEYAGDHWKMAKSLKTWATSPDIKICVSSRPYNEFEESFSRHTNLRLKLHELTREDMEQFVNDEFEGDERFLKVQNDDKRYLKLKNDIVKLADGVFLWVRLATHSLLTGLGNNFSISELEEKLKSIPTGLNDFFRKMWDSIDPSDRIRAARTFSVATYDALWDSTRMNMLTYSFLDDVNDNKVFVDELYTGKIRAITEDEIQERLQRTKQRLTGRCKGLLEIAESDENNSFFKYQVNFLHRTVREFLVQEDMQKELEMRAGNFDKIGSLCLVFLAQTKFIPATLAVLNKFHVFRIVQDLVELAAISEGEDSRPRLRELEALDDILKAHKDTLLSCAQEAYEGSGGITWTSKHGLDLVQHLSASSENDFSLIHHAAYEGIYSFVSRKIFLSPSFLESKEDLNILVSASLGAATMLDEFYLSLGVKLTKFLLDRGASPNEPLPRFQAAFGKEAENLVWTPWTLLLLGSIISVDMLGCPKDLRSMSELIELFLRNGADTKICLIGYQVKDVKEKQLVLGGPYYMTLEQLVEIWAPINAGTIRELLRQSSPKGSNIWLKWMTNPFQKPQQLTTPKIHIKPLDFDAFQGSYFAVTSIASIASLDKLTPTEIQFSAAITQNEEEGMTEFVRDSGLSIRVY